jgi:hypothetical protein
MMGSVVGAAGRTELPCTYFRGDAMEARQWEIAENLHRGELTGEEREAHVAEWVRITDAKAKAEVLSKLNTSTAKGHWNPEGSQGPEHRPHVDSRHGVGS